MKPTQISHLSLFSEWKNWLQAGYLNPRGRKPRPETVTNYEKMLLLYFAAHRKLSVPNMVAYWAQNQWPDSRRRIMYYAALSFARFLGRAQYESRDFVRDFEEFPAPLMNDNPRQTYVDPDQIMAMLIHLKHQDRVATVDRARNCAIVATMAMCGLRNSELCGLLLDNVNLEDRWLYFEGKGGDWRHTAITDDLILYLQEWVRHRPDTGYPNFFLNQDGAPLVRDRVMSRIRRIRKHFGIDLTPHGLRGSFATNALQAGAPAVMVSEILGHKDLKMINKYNRTRQTQAVEAMRSWVL